MDPPREISPKNLGTKPPGRSRGYVRPPWKGPEAEVSLKPTGERRSVFFKAFNRILG
jgi:hypothetical protein